MSNYIIKNIMEHEDKKRAGIAKARSKLDMGCFLLLATPSALTALYTIATANKMNSAETVLKLGACGFVFYISLLMLGSSIQSKHKARSLVRSAGRQRE